MADNAASARSVEEAVSVSMAENAAGARSVEGAGSVSMAENASGAKSVEGARSVSMAESAATAKTVETTAAANATVPFRLPKHSRGMSIAESAPPATSTQAQSEREQKRIRRPCRDKSAPAIRRRKQEMKMMTIPPRLGSSLSVLLW